MREPPVPVLVLWYVDTVTALCWLAGGERPRPVGPGLGEISIIIIGTCSDCRSSSAASR